MKFIIPVESIMQNKGGVILYDPEKNKILNQYVHDKTWQRSGWRGGIIHKGYFITTDWQDIHYFNIKKWQYEASLSMNIFNDLHYLKIKDGKLYIVNTGLDAITIVDDPLKLKGIETTFIWDKVKEVKRKSIDMKHDWSKEYKTNPHSCHPNCIEFDHENTFVTCFEDHTRGKRTGRIIELNSGQIVLDRHNCHDGNMYQGNFFLSGTRENQIYKIDDIAFRRWPVGIDVKINIGRPGWWRGMIIHKNLLYIFASYAYGENSACKMAVIDLTTNRTIDIKILPKHEGIKWDTIYQPNLLGG